MIYSGTDKMSHLSMSGQMDNFQDKSHSKHWGQDI